MILRSFCDLRNITANKLKNSKKRVLFCSHASFSRSDIATRSHYKFLAPLQASLYIISSLHPLASNKETCVGQWMARLLVNAMNAMFNPPKAQATETATTNPSPEANQQTHPRGHYQHYEPATKAAIAATAEAKGNAYVERHPKTGVYCASQSRPSIR